MEKEIKVRNFPNVRTIYISSEIDGSSLKDFKKDLDLLITADEEVYRDNLKNLADIDKSLADAYKKNIKYPPIYIDISSCGGSVYHGLAIYDILNKVNIDKTHKVIAKTNGMVASMATIIMLACDERWGNKNTRYLIHPIATFTCGKIQEVRDDLEETEELAKMLKEIYTKKTKLTEDKLNELDAYKKDWWLSAQEALDYGLITKIV
jgi:ATP-dependent protease ClpP protease subunit